MMAKMNWDKAKRREWKAEAKRERALERSQQAHINQAEWTLRQNQLASERQIGLIRKWNMHTRYGHNEELFWTLTKKQASELIDKYAKENNWKQTPKTKTFHNKKTQNINQNKKKSKSTYQPWKSSDIKVTNTKTGEIKIVPNTVR